MATRAEAAHILRRAGFSGTPAEITAMQPKAQGALIDAALVVRDRAPGAPVEITHPDLAEWEKLTILTKWWLERMIRSSYTDVKKPSPIVEKMTMFWHNHFATSADKVNDTRWMHQQNAIFRSNAVGSFRTLCHKVAVGPAMLIYLDNETNTKQAPNQNFARELMELFMLGIGNYTEEDVVAGAAAWSGHNLKYDRNWRAISYRFYADRHDTTVRTFLGKTQSWNGPQTIDWMLDSPVTGPICAKFICKKLWTWFVTPNPPQAVVDALAAVMISSNWSILAVLRAMFARVEFWDASAQNGLVRTPVEYTAAIGKSLGLTGAQMNPQWTLEGMGQAMFRPPNVSGWRPNEYWISTSAMSARADMSRYWTWIALSQVNPELFADVVADNVPINQRQPTATVVATMLERFSIAAPSPELVQQLTAWCEANRHRWSQAEPWTYWGERTHLLHQILMCSDFHLN